MALAQTLLENRCQRLSILMEHRLKLSRWTSQFNNLKLHRNA